MTRRFLALAGVGIGLWLGASGCHRKPAAAPTPPTTTQTGRNANGGRPPGTPAPPLSSEQLAVRPNEAGVVPILMYHSIDTKGVGRYKPDQVGSYVRSPAGFRKELQSMYDQGYRPVNLGEYLDNKMDVPLGKSPVVMTFDDARETQFKYLPDGSVDPDCAVGILQEFTHAHPDWPMKATFFVQPTPGPHTGFGQPESTQKKMQQLTAMGCEIENHTLAHANLKRLSDANVQKEIALCQQEIQKLLPQARVDEFALPFGVSPQNRALSVDGQYNGVRYHNRAVMLVGAGPAPAVIARRFNAAKIPRIQAAEGASCSTVWLNQIKTTHRAYISDGDSTVTTVPKSLTAKIDTARLHGSTLRTY